MDFAFADSQVALADLCDDIFQADPRGRTEGTLHDEPLWKAANAAGLTSVLVSEERGGVGLGAVDGCVVAQRCGAAGVRTPIANALSTRAAIDAMCAAGLLSASQLDPATFADQPAFMPIGYGSSDPTAGAPTVESSTGRLTGSPVLAPADAEVLVIWAKAGGVADALVRLDTSSAAVNCELIDAPGGRFAMYSIDGGTVDPADIVSDSAIADLKRRIWRLVVLLNCAELGGLADGALKLTAKYASRRRQFDRPIGTFQAVAARLADCYIDVEAMRWTLWRAALRYDERGDDDELIAIARVWACEGSDRVLAAAQHIHGGLGVDVSYPLHRYYLRARHLLMAAGGAQRHLADLGASLAEETSG